MIEYLKRKDLKKDRHQKYPYDLYEERSTWSIRREQKGVYEGIMQTRERERDWFSQVVS